MSLNVSSRNYRRVFIFLASVMLLFSIQFKVVFAQKSDWNHKTNDIHALKVGDKVPDQLWFMPLTLWTATDGKTKSVVLDDYREKTIVLDFWATWCSSCIASFPNLHELEKKHEDRLIILPVTYQQADKISNFYATSPIRNEIGTSFKTITEASLQTYFPRKTIPHTIIINPERTIAAITSPLYLTAETIANLLDSSKTYIPLKREMKLQRPLLTYSYNDVITHGKLYYSALTGYTDGFVNAGGVDTIDRIKRFYTTGQPILHLYAASLLYTENPNLVFTPNRRILMVSHPQDLIAHNKPDGSSTWNDLKWKNEHTFNYESLFPIEISETEIRRKMRVDLDFYFGLKSSVEIRRMKCLILSEAKQDSVPFQSNDDSKSILVIDEYSYSKNRENRQYVGKSERGAINYMRKGTISELVTILNAKSPASRYFGIFPPVINETRYAGKIDIDFPDELTDLNALKKILGNQGLKLEEEYRDIEMFILADPSVSDSLGELELTQFGYVPKSKSLQQ